MSLRAVLTTLFLLAAPALAQAPAAPADPAAGSVILLERGACEARCAVYRVVIFADGTVLYHGRYFVHHAGVVKSGISVESLNKLLADIDASGFFSLENNYGYPDRSHCDSFEAGEPSAILTVSSNGRSKTIRHNHGCAFAASAQLTAIEDKIDKAVGTSKWIK